MITYTFCLTWVLSSSLEAMTSAANHRFLPGLTLEKICEENNEELFSSCGADFNFNQNVFVYFQILEIHD